MKIFTRYVLLQFLSHVIISLMLFIFVLLLDRLFLIVNLIINKGLSIFSALSLIMYSLPTLIVISMPMGILSAGIITFGKMASDGEVTVLRTSGNTLSPMVSPVIIITLFLSLFMIPFNYNLAPLSQYKFRKEFFRIALKNPALRLEESTLIEIKPYTLLCLKIDHKKNYLQEVIIYKDSINNEPAFTITAKEGFWHINKQNELILQLANGSIRYQPKDSPSRLSNMFFKNHTIVLQSHKHIKKTRKNITSMTAKELKEQINDLQVKKLPVYKLKTRFYLRGALAGAIPVLLLIGIPLGIQAENKGKTVGIGLSLLVIGIYYFLMVAGIKLAYSRFLPPLAGVWLPNIIVGITGLYILYKNFYK